MWFCPALVFPNLFSVVAKTRTCGLAVAPGSPLDNVLHL
jgi:hypothetical protein